MSISVIIPTHNRCDLLQRAILSVLNQSILPKEIIVIDDLNDSKTRILCEGFSSNIIHYIPNLCGKGAASSRNLGILNSTSDYISFLDDDDTFKEDKIKELYETIKTNPYIDLIYHPAHISLINEDISYFTNPKFYDDKNIFFEKLLVQNFIGGTPMVTIKRDAIINIGLFDESLPALEDYELWLRCAKKGYKFHLLNRALTNYYHYTGEKSISKLYDENLHALDRIREKYQSSYINLSEHDIRKNKVWEKHMLVHKSLLNKNRYNALLNQLSLFKLNPTLMNAILILLIPISPKLIFKLRSFIQK